MTDDSHIYEEIQQQKTIGVATYANSALNLREDGLQRIHDALLMFDKLYDHLVTNADSSKYLHTELLARLASIDARFEEFKR